MNEIPSLGDSEIPNYLQYLRMSTVIKHTQVCTDLVVFKFFEQEKNAA